VFIVDEFIKVIILGIVEGITEFLPISSTGHLLISSALLDFQHSMGGTFEIFIQIGAIVAVVAFYRQDLLVQARDIRTESGVQRLWLAIIVAAVPVAVAGLLLRETIKDNLLEQGNESFRLVVIATMLIIGGIVFIVLERYSDKEDSSDPNQLYDITVKQAFLIGVAQTLALVPGVSRSGAAIIGGMMTGLNRQTATVFSFYLAIPVLGGATVLDLLLSIDEIDTTGLFYLLVGAFVSGIVAWIAIGWLLRYVAHHDFVLFGYYRIVAGGVILLLVAVNIL
jgi:undecaprenyl-diphosphatase